MILSKRYKEELNKIVMTEDMKKRILHNLINENIKVKSTKIRKNSSFRRKILIIAACFTIVLWISFVNSNPELSKYGDDSLIEREIDDTNKELQNAEVSELYDNNKDSNNYNEQKKCEIINQYADEGENYKESNSPKYNEDTNNSKTNKDNLNITNNNDTINNKEKDNDNGDIKQSKLPVTTCGGIIKEYKTLEEAEEVIKLKINPIKEIPNGFNLHNICVIANAVIEIRYNNGKDIIKFRAGKVSEDVSNDHNVYENENTCEINGVGVKIDGIKDKVINLATWKKDDIYYSISSQNGIDEEIILSMIRSSL
jgi:hypothetical protein